MRDFLNQNFNSLIYVIVAVISGVLTLILRFSGKITRIETSLKENIKPRVANIEQLSGKVGQIERKVESLCQNANVASLYRKGRDFNPRN